MYSSGIIRCLDKLGRIVVPTEIRRELNLNQNTKLEILIDNDSIVLREFITKCSLCGQRTSDLKSFKEAMLCEDCLEKLK